MLICSENVIKEADDVKYKDEDTSFLKPIDNKIELTNLMKSEKLNSSFLNNSFNQSKKARDQ